MRILKFCSAKLLHDIITKQTDLKGDQISTLFLWTLKVNVRWEQPAEFPVHFLIPSLS